MMRRVKRALGTSNVDRITNKTILGGTRISNEMVEFDWGILLPMKNRRGPPPRHSLQYWWCPFSPQVPLSLFHVHVWLLTRLHMEKVLHPTTSSATTDDSISGGASRTGVDTTRNHLARFDTPCREQRHQALFHHSSHVHLWQVDFKWGSSGHAGPQRLGNLRREKPDRAKGFRIGPPSGTHGVSTSWTFTLKALEPQNHLPWPKPLASAGPRAREDREADSRNPRQTSHHSKFGKERQGFPVELWISVPGGSGSKPLWFFTTASLAGAGGEAVAEGVEKRNLPPPAKDVCLNVVTVPLCEIPVTAVLYQYSKMKHLRSNIKVAKCICNCI